MPSTSPPLRKKHPPKKQPKPKQFPLLNLYILVLAIIEIVGQLFSLYLLKLLKPLPMILMIVYISGKNSNRDHLVPVLVRAGLILSLIGDVFLMSSQMSAFMIGTMFFLVAHILYCIAFTIGPPVRPATPLNKTLRLLTYLLFLFMLIGNNYILWPVMPNRLLFTSYSVVLCLMNIFAVRRYEITTPYSYGFGVAGAVLFGLSDNLLAMLKFNGVNTQVGRALVMLFYYSGQYLLMHGALHHSNLQYQLNKFLKSPGSATATPILTVGKQPNKYTSKQWDHGNGQEQFSVLAQKNKNWDGSSQSLGAERRRDQ